MMVEFVQRTEPSTEKGMMKTNAKSKFSPLKDLVVNIGGNKSFQNDYFHWRKLSKYKNSQQDDDGS